MAERDGFRIEFEGPDSGLLTLRFQTPQRVYTMVPSAIPRDSIADLVSALLVTVVRWNEEPQGFELCFARTQDQVAWTLYRLQPTATGGGERHRELATEGPAAALIRPFWKALRDLQTRSTAEEYAKRWYHPFPVRDMEQLTIWVHMQKA